jgi:hypothetical protein
VIGGKPIAILLHSISDVSAINPLVAFYDIHGGKREVLFFYFVPDTTRDYNLQHFFKSSHKKFLEMRYSVLLADIDIQGVVCTVDSTSRYTLAVRY